MKTLLELSPYDAEKALLRNLYTIENKIFKKAISDLGFHDSSLYAQLHNALYKGIYDPEELYEKGEHVMENVREHRDFKKSVTVADYMSPLELRMNAQGMFLAAIRIHNIKLQNSDTRKNLIKACYWAGRMVRSDYSKYVNPAYFGEKISPMNLTQTNATTLLKKLQTRLKRGELPKAVFRPYTSKEKNLNMEFLTSVYANLFRQVKTLLVQKGVESQIDRRDLFKSLNAGFFQTSLAYKYDLELILTLQNKDNFSISDLKANIHKLELVKRYLETSKYPSLKHMHNKFYNLGAEARGKIMKDSGVIPENLPAFYTLYAKQYSKELVAENKNTKQK